VTGKPDDAPEKEGGEPFLSRWSRRKEEARQAPPPEQPAVDAKAPPPELPPVESLTPESDYRPFFHPKVDEDVRRSALKKLFSDPRFNVMDGLDVYIDDYSKSEPIPPAMLAGMKTAQDILRWAKEDREEREREEAQRLAAGQEKAQALEPPAPAPDETQAVAPAAPSKSS
jgi:hypothetical protein